MPKSRRNKLNKKIIIILNIHLLLFVVFDDEKAIIKSTSVSGRLSSQNVNKEIQLQLEQKQLHSHKVVTLFHIADLDL
jgi:hypothetical protein